MGKKQVIKVYSKRKNKEYFMLARDVGKFYAKCEDSPSIYDIADAFGIDRRMATTLVRVAFIFCLITNEEREKIIAHKVRRYKKTSTAKMRDIKAYEYYVELADERAELIKKMTKKCVIFHDSQDEIRAQYLPRILEIENFAFK